MNKLWTFGDSFTESFAKKSAWKSGYLNWKGYTPNVYGEIISDKLKLQHINLAIGGTDNYTILDSIISVLNRIAPNDIVIIGWSNTIRFRVVNKSNTFNTILPNYLSETSKLNKDLSYLELSNTTLEEMCINRDNNVYINELNNYIKLLNFSFTNNKIIHWSPFAQDKQGLNTTLKTLTKYETINDETNGVVGDGHFSENAHKVLSEQLISIINDYDFSKLYNTSNTLI
jgi:hypothetical protein